MCKAINIGFIGQSLQFMSVFESETYLYKQIKLNDFLKY